MKLIRVIFFLGIGLGIMVPSEAIYARSVNGKESTVAIVIDGASYREAEPSVNNYASSIRKYDGKRAEIVICTATSDPDSIRNVFERSLRFRES
jgi:hypothetical protein